jgi:site-specific recombinase XerD
MKRQGTRYFTEAEKKRLLKFLETRPDSKRSEVLYKLMFATGLRLHEASNLNVGDVSGKVQLVIIGKGGKEREIPLSLAAREEISKFLVWKEDNGEATAFHAPLFISRKRRRLGCRAIQHDLDKWVKLATLEGKYSPHALRHTVGFELMRKTKNIRQVQEFLGHSFVTTTQIYTHVTKEELQECAELLTI